MKSFWGKVKMVLGAIIAVFVIVFLLLNRNATCNPAIDLVVRKYQEPSLLLVLLIDSVVSIIGWWLAKFLFRTVRHMSKREADATAARTMKEHAEIINRLQASGAIETPGQSKPPHAGM